MVPVEFKSLDEMIEKIGDLEKTIVETQDILKMEPKDALVKTKFGISHGILERHFPSEYSKQLLGYSDSTNRHFTFLPHRDELIVVPVSMLANIVNNFAPFAYLDNFGIESYRMRRSPRGLISETLDETISGIKVYLQDLIDNVEEYINQDGPDSDELSFIANMYLLQIDKLTEEELLDYSKAAYESTRCAPNAFYSAYLDNLDKENGVHTEAMNKLDRMLGRFKNKPDYTVELVNVVIDWERKMEVYNK